MDGAYRDDVFDTCLGDALVYLSCAQTYATTSNIASVDAQVANFLDIAAASKASRVTDRNQKLRIRRRDAPIQCSNKEAGEG